MLTLRFKKLDKAATTPTRNTHNDAGLDLYSLEGATVAPGEGRLFATGIAVEISNGHYGQLADRSSMAKKGFKLSGGIIDAGYRGDLGVMLRNISSTPLTVNKGDRIAQLIVIPIATPTLIEVEELNTTERGTYNWGSSGA